jgi:hypothetical protein
MARVIRRRQAAQETSKRAGGPKGGPITIDPLAWYPASQAARALHLCPKTFRALARSGVIVSDGAKGGLRLYSGRALNAWIEAGGKTT